MLFYRKDKNLQGRKPRDRKPLRSASAFKEWQTRALNGKKSK